MMTNQPEKGRGHGHVTHFDWGRSHISLERLTLRTGARGHVLWAWVSKMKSVSTARQHGP